MLGDEMSDAKKPIALEERDEADGRLFSPSVGRNKDVIRDAFCAAMPRQGDVLEIASGTGEHAVHIAAALPEITWWPSDPDEASRHSVAAWKKFSQVPNVEAPLSIDASQNEWPVDPALRFVGVASMNMIHIAPIEAMRGLLSGAGRLLTEEGRLFLYGPFMRAGAHTAPSNADFDASLKSRDSRWGMRDLDREVAPYAQEQGLRLDRVIDMPANNLAVTFARS